jgi:hypothetical protein
MRRGAKLLLSAVVVLAVPAGAVAVWQPVSHTVASKHKVTKPCFIVFFLILFISMDFK